MNTDNASSAQIIARLQRELDEAKAEVERLRIAVLSVEQDASCMSWHRSGYVDGWQHGAIAMRRACADWMESWENDGVRIAKALLDLAVPEEK